MALPPSPIGESEPGSAQVITPPPRWLMRDCRRISQFRAASLSAKTHSLSSDDAEEAGREDGATDAADDIRDGGFAGSSSAGPAGQASWACVASCGCGVFSGASFTR